MQRRKPVWKISIAAIAVVIVLFVVLISQNVNLSVPGSLDLKYRVSEIQKQELVQTIENEQTRMAIKAPDTTKWVYGDSGNFVVGIRNRDNGKAHTFYVNVYLDAFVGAVTRSEVAGSANQWVRYVKTVEIGPAAIETIDVDVRPANQVKGTYVYRVAICDKEYGSDYESCHSTSPGLYTDQSMSLYGAEQFSVQIS